ncbi:MAG TPA: methionine synthase [Candidatus Thermoplasmatota archaeon]|nr:methionine synthase [Candidatus Thermoplasmatota archaeon]
MNVGQTLAHALDERILVLDGAMGTMLQAADLTAADFGGEEYEGCNEHLNLTRPDVVRSVHDAYFAAGADIVETNTFGATPIVLAEYGLADQARAINRAAASIARASAAAHATSERSRYVAGSIGPTTKALTLTGGATFDELREGYRIQALGLIEGGVDALLVETSQDTLNVKAAAIGIAQAQAELGTAIPLMLSATIEPMGTMLAGQGVEAFYAAIEHFRPLTVGLNCATGPEFMTDHLRTLARVATCAIHVYPNAGLPDHEGRYEETPESLARKMKRFVDEGLVSLVGGCCGTTPAHVAALAQLVRMRRPPSSAQKPPTRHISGIEYLSVSNDPQERPILVGERTNVIGSRKFKRLVAEGRWEEGAEVGRAQVKNGAQVVDVCLADPDRDERADATAFLPHLTKKVQAPIMVDSTDADVIELALQHSQGKAIVNSINLEDGEERFERVVPLLKRYGAAVVVGCIDEDPRQGMALTKERKLAVAARSFRILTEKHGLAPEDIIFDPLVFPCASGDAQYVGSAIETIEGVRSISERFPRCATILGISNVSFGLPPAGREVLNSVFLYHCVQAGLTYAIVNTEALERYASIPEADRRVAEDLLWDRITPQQFAAHFGGRAKDAKGVKEAKGAKRTLEERLAACIIEGTKEGLLADLDLALRERPALEIINGPLMRGMDEVGRLFNANELIVAEVLQSAEAMKAAVDHLKPHMPIEGKGEGHGKGKVVLATVKGDVHDIGKNLVEIILSNNGYDVVNLGIKVAPDEIVRAVREHDPSFIGLSGLLVKSAQQMVATATDLQAAGISLPLLVGGAALTKRFTASKIAPAYGAPTFYARDAMSGLALANAWVADPDALVERTREDYAALGDAPAAAPQPAAHLPVLWTHAVPRAPDFERHLLRDVDVRALWPYVNPTMLFGKHLGLRGDVTKLVEQGDARAVELVAFVDELKKQVAREKLLQAHAVWRWFPANSDREALLLYDPDHQDQVIERFEFPRQRDTPRRCISDWVLPVASGRKDSVALFMVTAGPGVRAVATEWKEKGEYLRSHAIQALALETAEGFAEYVHKRIRDAWGIPDAPGLSTRDLFQANYQGLRVSFGYPACPDLADQAKLFKLLRPEEIGVQLTEGSMMDPEASVSALVFSHPEARYFDARWV